MLEAASIARATPRWRRTHLPFATFTCPPPTVAKLRATRAHVRAHEHAQMRKDDDDARKRQWSNNNNNNQQPQRKHVRTCDCWQKQSLLVAAALRRPPLQAEATRVCVAARALPRRFAGI